MIELIFSASFGFVCLTLLILKERERMKDKEHQLNVQKELLDRIMSTNYAEYASAQTPSMEDDFNDESFTCSENETSIYLHALGEELPPNLASEFSMNKGDVDGR